MLHPDNAGFCGAKRVDVLLLAAALGVLGCGARSSLFEADPRNDAGPGCAAPVKTWSQKLGGPRSQIATDMAVDASGYPVIVGAFRGELELNGTVLTSPVPVADIDTISDNFALSGNFFFARLAPAACGAMAKSFGPMIAGYQTHVAIDAGGAVVFAATFDGTIDFGGGELASTDGGLTRGAVIAKYDASGAHRWSKMFHATSSLTIVRPASDPERNVIVAGAFDGEIRYDGATLGIIPEGDAGAFVAMIGPDGGLLWSRLVKTVNAVPMLTPSVTAFSVAPWPAGGATLSGATNTETLFPEGSVNNFSFLVSFDGAGQQLALSEVHVAPTDLALGPSGELLGLVNGPGYWRLMRQTPGAAEATETKLPGVSEIDHGLRLAVDREGNSLLAGRRLDPDVPSPKIRAVLLSPTLDVTWSVSFGGPSKSSTRSLIVPGLSPNGDVLLGGSFIGAVDFGQGELVSPDVNSDVFIAEVTP